jgi:cytochrome c-type biogenesis protein CcmH
MWFYLAITVLAGSCATYLLLGVLQRRHDAADPQPSDATNAPKAKPENTPRDVAFYKRQLADVERDVAQGALSREEADRSKVEISRRLLEADKRASARPDTEKTAPKSANTALAVGVVALLFGMGGYLYVDLGSAGREDAPLTRRYLAAQEAYESRISQAEAEALAPDRSVTLEGEDLKLINQLRTALEQRPEDAVGHRLLAKQEAQLGNYPAARFAQTRVVELAGAEAATNADLVLLARIMVYGTNGYVSPEAEALWREIWRRIPDHAEAQFYMGLMYAQTQRPDVTFELWEPLLATAPANAPWRQTIIERIGEMAYFAGEKYEPTPQTAQPLTGPTSEDIAAASALSAAEQQEMILGMVAQLKQKLEDGEGTDDPEQWLRLLRAQLTLGDRAAARATLIAGLAQFPKGSEAADLLTQTAALSGLAP